MAFAKTITIALLIRRGSVGTIVWKVCETRSNDEVGVAVLVAHLLNLLSCKVIRIKASCLAVLLLVSNELICKDLTLEKICFLMKNFFFVPAKAVGGHELWRVEETDATRGN